MQTQGSGRLGSDGGVMLCARKQGTLESRDYLGCPSDDDSVRSRLEFLQRRLERVQSWAGPFSEVDFSPHAKALIRDLAATPGQTTS